MVHEVKREKNPPSPNNISHNMIAIFCHIRDICVSINETKNQERKMAVNKKEIF